VLEALRRSGPELRQALTREPEATSRASPRRPPRLREARAEVTFGIALDPTGEVLVSGYTFGPAAVRSSFFLKELLDEPFVGGLESRPLRHYPD